MYHWKAYEPQILEIDYLEHNQQCNLTPSIPRDHKLCLKHTYMRKDFYMWIQQNNCMLSHSKVYGMLLVLEREF